MRADETYSEDRSQFSDRNRDVLMNGQSPDKWWFTLKTTVFGLNSSLPMIFGGGGGLVCESIWKAHLLSDHFDGKQPRESLDLPLLSIRLRDLPPLPSGRVRSGVSC